MRISEGQMNLYNTSAEFPQNYNDTYTATKHMQEFPIEIPDDVLNAFRTKLASESFFLPDDDTIIEIISGLISGNIILQGPPGTGKTTLSKIICDLFNVNFEIITATSDWTTYDTIGGYQPSVDEEGNEIIEGKNGKVVDSIISCCNAIVAKEKHGTGVKQAHWLVIDELNRSEIDKVFGDLFTAFGNNSKETRKIKLWFNKDIHKQELFIPNRYRIIGTLNNVDKNFVFNLSQGLSRRFNFITINPPPEDKFDYEIANIKDKIVKQRVIKKLERYQNGTIDSAYIDRIFNNEKYKMAEVEGLNLIKRIRYYSQKNGEWLGLSIGTAQITDVYEMTLIRIILQKTIDKPVDEIESLCQTAFDISIGDKIVPQMEGFYFERLETFVDYLKNNFPNYRKCIQLMNVLIG